MTTNIYWTKDGKAKNLALLTSTERCEMLETLRQTEALEWIQRYRLKVKEVGRQKARIWWEDVKADILKKRGQAGLDTLTSGMNHDVNRI
jgi:hypothetical protein